MTTHWVQPSTIPLTSEDFQSWMLNMFNIYDFWIGRVLNPIAGWWETKNDFTFSLCRNIYHISVASPSPQEEMGVMLMAFQVGMWAGQELCHLITLLSCVLFCRGGGILSSGESFDREKVVEDAALSSPEMDRSCGSSTCQAWVLPRGLTVALLQLANVCVHRHCAWNAIISGVCFPLQFNQGY